ncbi:efflux pump, RND family, membrane fusion protein [Geotalea daltonii FRC-32]|uniref:Efflux pump, RND family, membrane fusion protein n=1 Tax=Geotalea daltonii (strain DSM 22248 / JCM 15807 / FRC-32) TaxID=316067 RepID=B9M6S7_GEODF|nr:HlyD family efflux transporter periplasmic adaptor subunit [Geotalea daltonii]ACM20137.1 efflux pump, RND family, membrane fusion protein [Geotalea daltonii FRC-32]
MKKKIAIIAVLAILTAAIAYFVLREEPDTKRLAVSGTIEVVSVEASFKVPGRVKSRLVDEGETVRVGQVLALLEPEDLSHDVARLEADRSVMEASLAELEAGSRREEIAQAQAAAARAEAEANRLEKEYQRDKALFAREVISQRQLDASGTAFETSRAAVSEAREGLALVRKGPRREKIDQARGRLKEAQAALAQAETRLGYATLTSPISGLVLSKHAEPGELVAAGTPVVTLGDITDTWLRAYISETDLGRVKVGQAVLVKVDTYPGRSYRGKVTFISPEAEFTPKNVQTEKERVKLVYRIKITVPNPQMELKPGMPADAEILLSAHPPSIPPVE